MIRQEVKIKNVAKVTGGKLLGDARLVFNSIATDSRTLTYGNGFLFVAISGEHHNGNKYIDEVYAKGVRCFLCDRPIDITQYPDAAFCIVDKALLALQKLAGDRRKKFDGMVIGITGSNGKTIVKEWIYQLLQHYYNVVRSPRSYNSQLGVPLSLWQLRDTYEFAIIEAGISERGEMERLAEIIRPGIGIITNVGTAHSENFVSESEKLTEKLKLFKESELLIYRSDLNVDGKGIDSFLKAYKAKLVSWSTKEGAVYSIKKEIGKETTKLVITHPENSCVIEVPFLDEASLENIIHILVCMLELDVSPDILQDHIRHIEPVEMRLETLNGIYGSTLVNDVYNSDLAGLEVALDVLKQQSNHKHFALILSDVFQSGLRDRELYGEVAKMIRAKNVKQFVGIGKAMMEQTELFPKGSFFYPDTDTFIQKYNKADVAGHAVLIKGARKFSFEKITQYLQAQYHKTVLEINVNKIIDNLNYYRSIIQPDTKVMVMVKALSYGAGGHEIALLLQHEKVDYLAVAFADEGVALRRAGLTLPIMVMNSDVKDFQQMIEYTLEPEIYSKEVLQDFLKICRYSGVANYPVHIKLDTGMHRLGFEKGDLQTLQELLESDYIKVKSVFTHLAGAYDETFDDFSIEQIEEFETIVKGLKSHLKYDFLSHVLNTAGIERFAKYQMDMVRVGIGLYGQGESELLQPVSTFRTEISQLRKLGKGETVGYGREGKIETDSIIATIPVGYADGIDRRLGNGNYSFFVNGHLVPTIGNICMDMMMIDVSKIDAGLGDVVELIGKDNSVARMAEKLNTITYEILTSIPERVKRVYVRE